MSPEQRHILEHSLGLSSRTTRPYRNHFAAEPASADFQLCRQLADAGLMEEGCIINQGTHPLRLFHVTEAGAAALGVKLPHVTPASAAILAGAVQSGAFAALKPGASRVYVVLLAQRGPRERFPEDVPAIAAKAGICARWARRGLKELYRAGLLVRIGDEAPPLLMLIPPGG